MGGYCKREGSAASPSRLQSMLQSRERQPDEQLQRMIQLLAVCEGLHPSRSWQLCWLPRENFCVARVHAAALMSFGLRHPASCLRHRREGRELLDTYTHAHATAVYVRQNWREGGRKKGGKDRREGGKERKGEREKGWKQGRWREGRDRRQHNQAGSLIVLCASTRRTRRRKQQLAMVSAAHVRPGPGQPGR